MQATARISKQLRVELLPKSQRPETIRVVPRGFCVCVCGEGGGETRVDGGKKENARRA